jgi:hypothetical protein
VVEYGSAIPTARRDDFCLAVGGVSGNGVGDRNTSLLGKRFSDTLSGMMAQMNLLSVVGLFSIW